MPVQPEWLQGRALAAWNSVVLELTAIGVTSRLDAGILASWASAMGTLAEVIRSGAPVDAVQKFVDRD